MPISKLSAPQPHELVRKVNELVDAVNSGGGGDNNPTGSLGVRRIDYELTADQYLQYDESSESYTLSVPYPEGFDLSNENAVISANFVFNNNDAISMPFQDTLRFLEQIGYISEMYILQDIVGSSISLASFKTSEPTLVRGALSQVNIAFFVAAEVDIPEGSGGECAGGLKIAAFNTPCSTLMSIWENPDEDGWIVELGFNVTDNGDGTVTLSDFGFTYDINATFFRDYWILMQGGDETVRLNIATFLDALVEMGIIKPNPVYGMGFVAGFDSDDKYTYIAFLRCECPPDTEDSSPLQDLTDLLSVSYLQIGYTIPEITEYEYNPSFLKGASKTTTNETTSTSHKTTIIDKLKSILEARSNDDI